MNQVNEVIIRQAEPESLANDLKAVLALLGEVNLPTEGVSEHFDEFLLAYDREKLVGCVGQERYGDVMLLRSLAVSPDLQRGGLGKTLTTKLLDAALSNGVSEVVLLTTTAKDFFARQFGFAETARSDFDEVFASSPEWRLPSCSSAACMRLKLPRENY
ncbi:MAG: GNAT family N-acetyltransferase [Acidobacteria bacterium]|nr:GNAT family N-acetyltransferase [Acidobacteriota bacterium]